MDVLWRGVCNHGTSVGDCPERVPAVSQMVTLRVGGTLGAWMHESNKNEESKAPQMPAGPGAQINGLQRENKIRMCGCWQLQKQGIASQQKLLQTLQAAEGA